MRDSSVLDIVDPGVLKEGRKEDILLVANLANQCLNLDGRLRPTMRDLAMKLKAVMSHDGALPHHLLAQTSLKEIVTHDNSYNDFLTSASSKGFVASKPFDTCPLLFGTTEYPSNSVQ